MCLVSFVTFFLGEKSSTFSFSRILKISPAQLYRIVFGGLLCRLVMDTIVYDKGLLEIERKRVINNYLFSGGRMLCKILID